MKQKSLRVYCATCRGEMDCFMDEDWGEAFCCKGCGASCSINFEKNSIEIDAKREDNG